MSLIDIEYAHGPSPVDAIEQVALSNDWSFERSAEDEITISATGAESGDYQLSFSWLDEFEALHLACAFDVRVPEARRTEVCRLLARVNERMLMGHFDLWEEEGVVMFRQTLLLTGELVPTSAQVEAMVGHALETCGLHHQAFEFVIWAGKTAGEALDAALFETVGEA